MNEIEPVGLSTPRTSRRRALGAFGTAAVGTWAAPAVLRTGLAVAEHSDNHVDTIPSVCVFGPTEFTDTGELDGGNAGRFLWFPIRAEVKNAPGPYVHESFVTMTDMTIRIIRKSDDVVLHTIQVPDGTIYNDPTATEFSTTFAGGSWTTIVPPCGDAGGGDRIFATGVLWQIPAGGLIDGIEATASGTLGLSHIGMEAKGRWSAGLYLETTPTDPNGLGVNPFSKTDCNPVFDGHAGVPSLVHLDHFIGDGGTGGGGSNWIGSNRDFSSLTCE